MLHAEVLARLKHPRPEMLNGKQFEARATPVHFMMTANHKAPSIEIARVIPPDARPPSPPLEPGFDGNTPNGRSAGPQDIIGSEPNEEVPHVMISLALEEDQRLNINDWEHWLSSIPALAKYVKVQGVFKSHSTLLLLSLPVMVWDLLPENHACNFIAFIRSNNLVARNHGEPRAIEEEVSTGADIDADLRSIYSGTTAYTAAPFDSAGGPRMSMMSAFSGKSPIDPACRGFEPSIPETGTTSTPAYHAPTQGVPMDLPKPPLRGWSTASYSSSSKSRAKPGFLHKSMSYGNIAQQLAVNQPRGVRRPSVVSTPSQPELPQHVQTRLEDYFQSNPTPTVAVKEFLASNLGIETANIDVSLLYHRITYNVY